MRPWMLAAALLLLAPPAQADKEACAPDATYACGGYVSSLAGPDCNRGHSLTTLYALAAGPTHSAGATGGHMCSGYVDPDGWGNVRTVGATAWVCTDACAYVEVIWMSYDVEEPEFTYHMCETRVIAAASAAPGLWHDAGCPLGRPPNDPMPLLP